MIQLPPNLGDPQKQAVLNSLDIPFPIPAAIPAVPAVNPAVVANFHRRSQLVLLQNATDVEVGLALIHEHTVQHQAMGAGML